MKEGETVTNEQGGSQSHLEARLDLIPGDALIRIGKILSAGAGKYGEWNWKKIPVNDHLNHALVHIYKHLLGSPTGEDDLGNAACRILFALHMSEEIDKLQRIADNSDRIIESWSKPSVRDNIVLTSEEVLPRTNEEFARSEVKYILDLEEGWYWKTLHRDDEGKIVARASRHGGLYFDSKESAEANFNTVIKNTFQPQEVSDEEYAISKVQYEKTPQGRWYWKTIIRDQHVEEGCRLIDSLMTEQSFATRQEAEVSFAIAMNNMFKNKKSVDDSDIDATRPLPPKQKPLTEEEGLELAVSKTYATTKFSKSALGLWSWYADDVLKSNNTFDTKAEAEENFFLITRAFLERPTPCTQKRKFWIKQVGRHVYEWNYVDESGGSSHGSGISREIAALKFWDSSLRINELDLRITDEGWRYVDENGLPHSGTYQSNENETKISFCTWFEGFTK
jgi:hypothetical protein